MTTNLFYNFILGAIVTTFVTWLAACAVTNNQEKSY